MNSRVLIQSMVWLRSVLEINRMHPDVLPVDAVIHAEKAHRLIQAHFNKGSKGE